MYCDIFCIWQALATLKQKVRKYNKEYEDHLKHFRENPDLYKEEEQEPEREEDEEEEGTCTLYVLYTFGLKINLIVTESGILCTFNQWMLMYMGLILPIVHIQSCYYLKWEWSLCNQLIS